MKARVHYFRTAKEKRLIHEEIELEYKKIEAEKRREMAERILKVVFYVLSRDLHFGAKRTQRLYNSCGELLASATDDPVFWEKIDREVIDRLGLTDFTRDYTDRGKAVRYD